MDQETGRVEDKVLDRRSTLKALFGLAAVAVGATAIMMPGAAEAAPLTPPVAGPQPAAKQPDEAKDSDLPDAEPTQYYYRRRVYRRRYIYRPRRRVYYRRRYVRRVYF